MKNISRLFKYLMPYKSTLIMILFSFLIQQMCTLFLPTLMSDIVDVGIRQSGIENASPEAMSANAYELLTSFMTSEEKSLINVAYAHVGLADVSEDLKIKYPLVGNEKIYTLKDSFYTSRDTLDVYFLHSATRIMKYLNIKNGSLEQESSDLFLNVNTLYELLPQIKNISNAELLEIDSKENSFNFDVNQIAANINKQIYTELKMDVSKIETNYILKIGFFMIIITIISLLVTVWENYLSCKMSSGILTRLREDVFRKVSSFSESEFNKISTSSLITRTINDVTQMKDTILMGLRIFVPPIMLIGGMIMAWRKSVSMSWLILLGAVISSTVIISVFIIIFPKVGLLQKLLDKFNLIIRERLTGLMVIKSFGNMKIEEEKFDDTNKELSDVSIFINRLVTYVAPFLTIAMNVIGVLILWLGANQISKSNMQVGDLMAFMQYSTMVIGAFLVLVMMFSSLPHAFVSIQRIFEVLDLEPTIKESEICRSFSDDFREDICFKNVSFSYGNTGNFALKNVSFTAQAGQVVSIIGPIGSGKSTLVSLIPRFYDVTSGEILIDGINIKDVAQDELREKVSFVPQRSILFTGDVEYNLKYGNPCVDEDRLSKCIEVSQLSDIMGDKGLKREVAQEGKNFSGGQRQRICIARALARNTPIYIFDDSFSAMDFKTDSTVREKMLEITKDSLVIIVSQRIGSVMNSDRIIVLDKGEIVGQGTHEELITNCLIYKQIAESQLPEEMNI